MIPGAHVLAGFRFGFHYRYQLRQLLEETAINTDILKLDPKTIHAAGVTVLALDFDGVLASHGSPVPLPDAVAWMKRCEAVFGSDCIFILSNKPTVGRKKWFTENFPAMRFISGVRKKPYPDGLNKTGELAGVPLSSIMMVDDRLLTGCLAALVAGARPSYIRRPYINLAFRPCAELFFWKLRFMERLFVKLIALF